MPAWTLHDLRRTFATGLARLEIPVHVTEAVLNHKSGSIKGVAAVYNRYSYDAEKRNAMTTWSKHIEQLLSGAAVI
jgi:integrase